MNEIMQREGFPSVFICGLAVQFMQGESKVWIHLVIFLMNKIVESNWLTYWGV